MGFRVSGLGRTVLKRHGSRTAPIPTESNAKEIEVSEERRHHCQRPADDRRGTSHALRH